MLPNGQESLSTDAQATLVWRRLLWRSGIAILVITGLILVVSLLPFPAEKKRAIHRQGCSDHAHLRHVMVLHRHGERSPVRWYEFEGEWAWKATDIGIGKLSVHGIRQAFQLGQNLRSTYAGNMKLDQPGVVTCYSTDLDRTVDTAHSVLLGLLSEYETKAKEVDGVCKCRANHGERASPDCLASCLNLPSVPKTPEVQVRLRKDKHGNPPPDKDAAFYQTDVCKGYNEWRERLESSEKWLSLPNNRFSVAAKLTSDLAGDDLVKTLNWPEGDCGGCLHLNTTGYDYLGFMETIWSDLVCYEAIGTPYDATYTNKQLLHEMQPMSEYVWKKRFSPEAGRMAGGVLLNEWLQVLQQSAALWRKCGEHELDDECAGSEAKMTVYSAHDTTVFSLLAALGATPSAELPGFTSHVVMELWEAHNDCTDSHDFNVQIRYDPFPYDAPGARRSGGLLTDCPPCKGGKCRLEDFVKATEQSRMAPDECTRHSVDELEDSQCCSAEAS